MGPDELCLEFAGYILDNHPNITIDRRTLAYTIQFWVDDDLIPNLDREHTCNHMAQHIITEHPSISDDIVGLAQTIQDFIDIIEVRLNDQQQPHVQEALPAPAGEDDAACAVEGAWMGQPVHDPHDDEGDDRVNRLPTMMEVVVGGVVEQRRVEGVDEVQQKMMDGTVHQLRARLLPELHEGETLHWIIGDYRPHITKETHMNIEVFRSGIIRKQWYFRFRARNGQIVAQSEGYHNKQDCINTANSIKRRAADAQIIVLED